MIPCRSKKSDNIYRGDLVIIDSVVPDIFGVAMVVVASRSFDVLVLDTITAMYYRHKHGIIEGIVNQLCVLFEGNLTWILDLDATLLR